LYLFVGFGYWGKVYYKYLKTKKLFIYTRNKINYLQNYINASFINGNLNKIPFTKLKKIFIISPINTHLKLCTFFSKYKKKILVEKPLIFNYYKKKYYKKKFNNLVFVSYPYTYSKSLKKISDVKKYRDLGKLKYIYINFSQPGRFSNDNNVYELLGPHALSALNCIIKLKHFKSNKKNLLLNKNITETGQIILENKRIQCLIYLSLNYLFGKKKYIELFFENGHIKCDFINKENIKIIKYSRKKIGAYNYVINNNIVKTYSIDEKNNMKYVIDNFMKNQINFSRNFELTSQINRVIR